MSECTGCGGDCSSCTNSGNCRSCMGAGPMVLTSGEIEMLQKLGQIPFLPVARTAECPDPVYLEETDLTKSEYSLILQCLEKRGLISLDFDQPLKDFDDGAYAAYPIRGSFTLTARGQKVLELLEIQGLEE